MPIRHTSRPAPGEEYVSIIFGDADFVGHQLLLDAAALAASRDASGLLPPGLPVNAAGGPSGAGAVHAYIGPEPVRLGDANIFGNIIIDGVLHRAQMERNLGRVLTAAEATPPAAIRLL